MRPFLRKLARAGLDQTADILDYQRVLVTNAIALAVMGFSLVLFIICVWFSLHLHMVITVISFFLILLVFWFNARGYPRLASFYLLHFTGLMVAIASYNAFLLDRVTETENWLYAFLALTVFLFDRWKMRAQFAWFVGLVLLMKFLKYQLLGWPMDTNFWLMLINVIILCSALFVFLVIFKSGFRRMLLDLHQSNESKSKLFKIVAHDIRNPLAALETLLEMGQHRAISAADQQKHQEMLAKRFGILKHTIDSMLLWAQSNLEDVKSTPQVIDPRPAVSEVQDSLVLLRESKKITVEEEWEDIRLYMDPYHFKIIVRNLLHNALKFTPSNGQVTVMLYAQDGRAQLEIIDSGMGISDEVISKLHSRVEIDSSEGTMGEKGTGLGLALSKELLEKNKGHMHIERPETGGTRFLLDLPLVN